MLLEEDAGEEIDSRDGEVWCSLEMGVVTGCFPLGPRVSLVLHFSIRVLKMSELCLCDFAH